MANAEAESLIEDEAVALAFPLTYGQRALWFLERLSLGNPAYIIAGAAQIQGRAEPAALRRAALALAARHPALRTTFHDTDAGTKQRVGEASRIEFVEVDAADLGESELPALLSAAAFAPFDLERGPLWRMVLARARGGEQALALAIHHIVADFWSLAIVVRELGVLYMRELGLPTAPLPDAGAGIEQVVQREEELLAGEAGDRLWAYWRQALSGVPLALDLPADRPRPAVQSTSGAGLPWRLPATTVDRLRRLSRRQGATLYMALLAGFEALLHRSTGAERMVVGCPTTGRGAPELAGLVGYLVNAVPIVGDVAGDPDFLALLDRARTAARGAFAHKDYPLALLAERLELARDPSRSPIFQVSLVLQKGRRAEEQGIAALAVGEAGVPLTMGSLALRSLALPEPGAQFDLTLMLGESGGGELVGHLQYSRDLFEAATIARLGGHLAALLQGAADDPGRRLAELPLLTAAEHAQLAAWNATAIRYPGGDLTLPELLARQAAATPDAVAVVASGEALTYAGLEARASALAGRLRGLGVGPESVVGLCADRSLPMMVGLLAILKAGGAYLPLAPTDPVQRLAALLADTAAPVLLAQEHLLDRLPAPAGRLVLLDEQVRQEEGAAPPLAGLAADNLAYVIFTSGSTGRPKGVMNSHRGIVNRLLWAQAEHGLAPADRVLQKTPYSFDVSAWELFWPLLSGACLVLARPGGHQDSAYLVQTIADEAITVAHFVPSMLGAFLAEPDVERCATLKRVMASGEALPPDLARQLFARLDRVELHNLYGPTEAAVEVTFWACERQPRQPGMPIGRPIGNTRIHLLDRQGNEMPVGVAGELAIGGVQVARGYVGRPELTAERFVPDPFVVAAGESAGRLYRTGDLARRRPGGEIEYLGRLDHQIKLRGFRVELGEIETVLLGHPTVRAAAVTAAVRPGQPGDLRLVAYVAGREGEAPVASDLRKHLAERLPEYMVPSLFVALQALPLTASGKVDRRALPPPVWTGDSREPEGRDAGRTRTPVEELLALIWAEVLGLPDGARINAGDSFFDLGGHSLLATQVVSRVRRAFGVELPVKTLFEASTLAGLAARLEVALALPGQESVPPIVPAPRTAPLRLSFAQERLWFLDRLTPGSASYNMPGAVRLSGKLSVAALASAFGALLERHQVLRTTFAAGPEGPVQVIAASRRSHLPLVDLSGLPPARGEDAARRLGIAEAACPFDLARGPLLRTSLLRLAPERHLVLATLHHVVADGWSLGVLVRELAAFYAAALDGRPSPLPALPLQYADFAAWQRGWLSGGVLAGQLEWWRRRLAAAPTILDLPTDRPRPPLFPPRGGVLPIALPAATAAGLLALARGSAAATLFMTLFAGFSALLSRWTGQEDLLVGSPVAGRTHREIEDLIGFFVNTLVLRAELAGRPSFGELIGRVREMTLGAYAHQDVPFERLVEEIQPQRDLSRSPLFQVLLVLQNQPASPFVLPGLTLEPLTVDAGEVQCELHLSLTETAGELVGTLSYAAALFDRTTMERLAGHLATLLAAAVAAPGQSLAELPLLTPAERSELTAWNATATVYAEAGWTLPELLDRQAAATPDAVAMVAAGEHLTYGALAVAARSLAAHLCGCGVGPETAVGLCAERSLDLGIAVWAIVAAGGAYLPLDPSYPAARLAALLTDAAVPVVLAQEHLLGCLPEHGARVVLLGKSRRTAAGAPLAAIPGPAPDNLAYLLFTSGSTGRPKGVMNSHRGIVNRLLWGQAEYRLSAGDRVLQKTPFTFDISVWELFWPLLNGACLVFAHPGGHQDSAYLVRTLAEQGITVAHFVPSMLAAFLAEPEIERCSALRQVLASGEALSPELARQLLARLERVELHNLYGPTEAAVEVTYWACARAPSAPGMPIGRPVANTQIRLLDREGHEVPVGVAGELAIGGVQVARGYVGRPDLTAERFVPDAFQVAGGRAGARLYRTGDLARRRAGGEIEYLGRLDHQVKVRGFRIELGEIESLLLAHPEVAAAAVVAREARTGDLRLVAYVVGRAEGVPATSGLAAYLGERLPEHMVPALFVPLAALPATASGKVDRRALPAPSWGGERHGGRVAPRTPGEEILAAIWSEVLGLGDDERPGVFDNFFALGGHSLLATRLVSRLRRTFGVDLPVKAVFEAPTVAALAARLEQSEGGPEAALPPLVPLPRTGELPLSFAQERLWLLDQLEPGSAAYNIAGAVRLSGDLSVPALAASLAAIAGRHEALRTTFQAGEKGPVQAIAPACAFSLPFVDLGGLPAARREEAAHRLAAAEAARPFDLRRGPLLRGVLLRLSGAGHLVLLTLHHIVADGWSMAVFVRELAAFYAAAVAGQPAVLAPLPVQYADFAAWQRGWLAGEELTRQLSWWRQHLAGAPALLELTTDRPRRAVRRLRGGTVPVSLPAELTHQLTALGREWQATLFMMLLAGFAALLGRLAGSRDVVIGSPVANRRWTELEGLVGFFVNTLALRTDLSGGPGLRALLDRVRKVTLEAYAHQDLPFEKLVEELAPQRSLSHSPLFQVVLALQNAPPAALELPGLQLDLLPVVEGVAKFDLNLDLTPAPAGEAGIAGTLEYDRDLFDRTTVLRLRDAFVRFLAAAVAAPERDLRELPLLSPAERRQLADWRGEETAYPRQATVAQLFFAQAARSPDAVAVVAAGPGGETLSYGELAARAARLGAHLAAQGVGPEVPVGLLLARSPGMVVSILAVLAAGGAYVPFDADAPPERLAQLFDEARVAVLVSTARLAGLLPAHAARLVLLEEAAPPGGRIALGLGGGARAENLVCLLFTAGSTGRPKGVAIVHRGVVRLVRETCYARFCPAEVFLQLAPIAFHAAALEIWGALLHGGRLVLPSPAAPSPDELGEILSRHGVTTLWLTAGRFHAMAERDLAALRPVRQLLVGGDALFPSPVDKAIAGLPWTHLSNAYGLAEGTALTCCEPAVAGLPGPTVPIGRPIAHTEVAVVMDEGDLAPLGVAGELVVGGDGLARGYWRRPDLTAERFRPDPWSRRAGGRVCRTGDLARWLPEGRLELLGRLDRQVRVHGLRIQEVRVESALLSHPAVTQAVVVLREDRPLDPRLVAYVVAGEGADLRGYLRERLPEHMVPAAFVRLAALPLWSDGRIDRASLPVPEDPAPAGGEPPTPTRAEGRMREIWSEVLGVEESRIGRDDSFFDFGGNSLLATLLAVRVRESFGVDLPVKTVFEGPRLVDLAGAVERALAEGAGLAAPPVLPVPRTAPLRLSFAQERVWFLEQLAPGSASYNVASTVRLAGKLSVAALEAAFAALLERHEALRTTFRSGEDGPVQWIAPAGETPLPLPLADLGSLPETVREVAAGRLAVAEAARPFDLVRGPLLRSMLLRLGPEHHLAVVNIHHIVADGWSLGVFVRELAAFYEAALASRPAPLPALPVQYADFAVWQRGWLSGEVLESQLGWWRQRLAAAPMVLELPTDRPRPAVLSPRGKALPITIPAATVAGLAALAQRLGATLFMTLFAGFSALLSRWAGQEDLLLGSPVAGRTHRELEGLIGFFANTLVLRAELAGQPSFGELVERVREMTLGAYAHQDLPFERLVEELHPVRDLSRSPLFQVFFVLQNQPGSPFVLPGLTLEPALLDGGVIQFELHLSLIETAAGLVGTLSYAAALFDRPTVERLVAHLATLLAGAAQEPGWGLAALPLLTPAEVQQFREWNATDTLYGSAQRCLHELLEEQAGRTPAAAAVRTATAVLTYGELDRQANALARRLRGMGVGPEVCVAIAAERSLELMIGLLAILKAGGAYLPLDLTHPADRLAYMLADAEARVLLVQPHLAAALPAVSLPVVALVPLDRPADGEPPPPRTASGAGPANLAYVIYTSGSTGRPKGVMNTHRGIVNRLLWGQQRYGLGAADRVLQKTPVSFDVSIWELFWPLLAGAELVMARPGGHQDPAYLVDQIVTLEITTLHFVPSMLRAFLETPGVARCGSLARVFASGEALPRDLERRYFAELGAPLYNLYGPTEAAVEVTHWTCEPEGGRGGVPIGRPVANTRIHLFDRELRPLTIGAPGELYIGGVQLARGYRGQPALTAERFVPDVTGEEAGARLYRSGDVARWLADGAVDFLGRADRQVKVRGFRIELGEIESVLLAHPTVGAAVVTAREAQPGDLRLVAYVMAGSTAAELRQALARRLPEYMVPSTFVLLPALPLLANGKVDRRALPAPVWAGERHTEKVAPRTPGEEILVSIWSGVLGLGDGERPGVFDDFFALGGHSLLATRLVSRLRQAFGVELPLKAVFEAPTIAALAARLESTEKGRGPAAPPLVALPREGELPLSFAQERLWFLDQLEPGSAAYNIPGAVRLSGNLSVSALAASLAAIVDRHEALRTTFQTGASGPVQAIAPSRALTLPLVDLEGLAAERRETAARSLAEAEAARPFDLRRGPLLRNVVLRLSGASHLVLLTMHHTVSDGWSIGVFIRELTAFYTAALAEQPAVLPPLAVQYADFAVWQRGWLAGEELTRQLAWWREHLTGAPALLALPTDRPRPAVRRFRGGAVPLTLPEDLVRQLTGRGRESQATLFMTLLAGFAGLLGRLSGSLDLVVGSPVANRRWAELEGLIGFFVNTLALRTALCGAPGMRALVNRVRKVALEAYAHQDLPFEKLVEELAPQRSLGSSPLFQVVLALQNAPLAALELPGLTLKLLPIVEGVAKFDLNLTLAPRAAGEAGIAGTLEYDHALFDRTTALRVGEGFVRLLAAAVAAPDRSLWELPLLSPAESQQLAEWRGEGSACPPDRTVAQLFFAQAARTPDAVAVVSTEPGGETLSYGGLAVRAAQLGARLAALEVGPEVPVGIFLDRSPGRIVATLAVLAAGGACVPFDPGDPAERLGLCFAEARVPVVVSTARLAGLLPAHGAHLVLLEEAPAAAREITPGGGAAAENLACLLFTAGSNGRPRGVAIVHRGLAWLAREPTYARFTPEEVFLQRSPVASDAANLEIWGALLNGGRLVLPAAATPDPDMLAQTVSRHGVTTLWLTAALFHLMVERHLGDLRPVRQLLVGGEALSAGRVEKAMAGLAGTRLIHGYGLPEATTLSCCETVAGGREAKVSIGRPIDRCEVSVLAGEGEPVPLGVTGELAVGGDGLARGYWRRPDLTAERFRPDPLAGRDGARACRTGDRARWLPDGRLELLGRRDRQVELHGFRIELGEIESALASHPEVVQAVATVREDSPGDRRLVAYVVGGDGADLREYLRERLPEHMVPAVLVRLASLPLAADGKVDRAALPAPETSSAGDGDSSPRTPAEALMREIWSEVLGIEASTIGRQDSFFDFGGNSLLATLMAVRVRDAFGVDLPLRRVFAGPTVAALAARLEPALALAGEEIAPPLVAVPRPASGAELPLSFAQQRLWFVDQLDPGNPAYNIPLFLRLVGPLAVPALWAALAEVLRRHEALRSRFPAVRGVPVQTITREVPRGWLVVDHSALALTAASAATAELARLELGEQGHRFALDRGPLLRALLVRRGEEDHALLLTVHHIAFDGWSLALLARELEALYTAACEQRPAALPRLPVQYADYAAWQRRLLSGRSLDRLLAYWTGKLSALPPPLALPYDRPRPDWPGFRGSALPLALPPEVATASRELARREGATLFVVLLAGFKVFLAAITGQLDVMVGSPVAGRTRTEVEPLIGMFMNTLVLRTDLAGDPTFAEVVRRVRSTALAAYDHQDLPYEKLVDAVLPARQAGRPPLSQVWFVLQNQEAPSLDLAQLHVEPLPLAPAFTKFDLALNLSADPTGIAGQLEYPTDLFDEITARHLAGALANLLARALADPELRLTELAAATATAFQAVQAEWRRDFRRSLRSSLMNVRRQSSAGFPEKEKKG